MNRDDNHDNPFKSYDFYKGYCPDDFDDDDIVADDIDPDYVWDNLTGK